MSNRLKGIVDFEIDDISSPLDIAESDVDYPLSGSISYESFLHKQLKVTSQQDLTYSNKAVKKAGRSLRRKEGDLKMAATIIQQYRAAHEQPLEYIAHFVEHCCKELGLDVKPVTRLKRLETIVDKLQRDSLDGYSKNATCVSNMNDIGGCRVILPDLISLQRLAVKLNKASKDYVPLRIKNIHDYIKTPKLNDCGYRSLHVIFQYSDPNGKRFNIEVQLRTKKQHLWATTVEIVDILQGTKIKTHSHSCAIKDETQIKWEALLKIMSGYIADVEGCQIFSPEERHQFLSKLCELNKELRAVRNLEKFTLLSEKATADSPQQNKHVLLMIDESQKKKHFYAEFDDRFYQQIISIYNIAERMTQSDTKVNTLLISSENIGQLTEAYPNYLGDCTQFIELLKEAMRSNESQPA